jgi:putative transposase
MKTSRYTEAQIIAILRQAEGGVPVAELCREHGMSTASFYKWRAKYGGMDASLISQMKAMEEENRRLKRMYADPRPGNLDRQVARQSGLGRPAALRRNLGLGRQGLCQRRA